MWEFGGAEPGNAILLNGALEAANREIGVPGIQVVDSPESLSL